MSIKDRLLPFFFGFKIQLLLFYTVISLFVLALGSYFGYTYIMNILKQQNERYVLLQFHQSDNNIQNFFNEIDRLSNLLLQEAGVDQFLQYENDFSEYDQIANRVEVISRIDSFLSNYTYINSIYIFAENGGAVGSSARNSLSINAGRKDAAFYQTEMYRGALTSYPKLTWFGAYKEDFFNERIAFTHKENAYLISAVKRSRMVYSGNQTGSLVFNFDERYLASIYSGSIASKDSLMFIVDGSGKIISSSNGKRIGATYSTASEIKQGNTNGSFSINDGNTSRQIVYYKVRNSDWYLIEEMPVTIFSRDIVELQKVQVIIFIASLLFIFAASLFWLGKITKPLNMLAGKMREMSQGKLGIVIDRIPRNELGFVITRFNEMSLGIVELLNKNEKMQNEKRELEIEALQLQINPHFLYNTLNMIKWMAAIVKAGNIVDSITALGNILKPVFSNSGYFFTLREELEYVGNYIKIMNWRFGNGVRFQYEISECYMNYRIPRFILQPLIENSITHGMRKPENKIDIAVEAKECGNNLVIVISDTGVGIPAEKVDEINLRLTGNMDSKEEESIGIMNVNRRIRLSYGSDYGIKLDQHEEGGTRVAIYLPKPEL